jgi:putative ABC transport system permease protein
VLAFAILAALVAVAIFGVLPAVRASRPDVGGVLRAGGRAPGLAGGRMLRNGVVVAAVALSFVLLVGGGLMMRSFVALQQSDPGYDPRNLLTFVVNTNVPQAEARLAFMRTLKARLEALPGVQGVTAATPFPLDEGPGNLRWGKEEAQADPSKFEQANVHMVLPGYFETMRTRLVAGRTFTEDDNRQASTNIIVDERLAAKAFPGRSAVGQRLLVRVRSAEPEWLTIVGVVDHQRHETLVADGDEAVFVTDGFMGTGVASRWAVRTTGDPAALGPAVRAIVREIDPRLPIAELQPFQVLVDRARAPTRFALVLIAVFAVVAAALAAVGIYGVLATAVRQRTAEIGVRIAIGAPRRTVFGLVMGEGLKLSAAGVALGLAGALLLTRVLQQLLVEVRPTDPASYAGAAAMFVVIALVACWIPARRAAALPPTEALRSE